MLDRLSRLWTRVNRIWKKSNSLLILGYNQCTRYSSVKITERFWTGCINLEISRHIGYWAMHYLPFIFQIKNTLKHPKYASLSHNCIYKIHQNGHGSTWKLIDHQLHLFSDWPMQSSIDKAGRMVCTLTIGVVIPYKFDFYNPILLHYFASKAFDKEVTIITIPQNWRLLSASL